MVNQPAQLPRLIIKLVTERFAGATTGYSGPGLHDVFADTPML
jgi:hypothetical protein